MPQPSKAYQLPILAAGMGHPPMNGYTHSYANTAHTAVTAATANAIPTNGDVNPQQLDNMPFAATAAVGVPLDQIPDLIDVHVEAVPHPGAATAQLN